jgi:hypothetical protein
MLFIGIALLVFSACKTSKSTPGQYHGQITKQRPCPQGCD